jgi:hypothetical protein
MKTDTQHQTPLLQAHDKVSEMPEAIDFAEGENRRLENLYYLSEFRYFSLDR